jgi:hypothetical protein
MSRGPSIFRQSDVTRAIKGAAAAGVDIAQIARIEIDKAGKIVIITVNGADARDQPGATEANEWDRV